MGNTTYAARNEVMYRHHHETALNVAHFLHYFEALGLFHQLLSYHIFRKARHEVRP